ncbi:MAG: DEAD/DEAH box helicase family protein [Clostridiales Family XIII bacterium]|jgi:superfamily II DNA or RNA helicase|nr:DEAD/DEAH box helicase family protein [Clostridiales Family XIII bacterium]
MHQKTFDTHAYSLPRIRLYPWQEDCLARWFDNGCRGIAGVATGAGKTLLALAAAYHLAARRPAEPLKIKIIVPKVFLAAQWRADIMHFLGVPRGDIGLYCGAIKEDSGKPFMIYVINTARLCVSRHILKDASEGASVLLICDECHHFGSAENAHVFDFLPHVPKERYFALGLSATPEGENYRETVVPALGREIYRYDLSDAARDRIIADCAVFHIAVDFLRDERDEYEEFSQKITALLRKLLRICPSLRKASHRTFFQKLLRLQSRGGEEGALAGALVMLLFRRKEVIHKARMRMDCGAEIVRRLMPDHRIILFTERIETADILFNALHADFPGQIGRYHSNMGAEEKTRALDRYRSGEIKVIVCCRALDEGLNVPETDAGIILSVGSGARQRIQRIGRILRRGRADRPKKIYYLHIADSAEAEELLPAEDADAGIAERPPAESPEAEDSGIGAAKETDAGPYRLAWTLDGDLLPDPAYAALSERVTEHLIRSGASERHLRNAKAHLDRGCVRTDFLLPESACREGLERARPDEKDYWIAMLLMARSREGLL